MLGRLADLAMLALLATTGLVLLYLVIGGIGMLIEFIRRPYILYILRL
jgi:preprotein translocase subunit Sss1